MPKRFRYALGLALAVAGAATLYAGTQEIFYNSGANAGNSTGVFLTTPNTYASCPRSATSDIISTTGVGSRQLKGAVIVQYVTDGGRVIVPGGYYAVDQTGDLNLQVWYPAVSDWPEQANGTRELHIDVAVELFEDGVAVASLGPGNDWDIFCLEDIPPPPPPPGDEGCTPGYWKQPHHYDSYPAPYTPFTLFSSAFGVGPNITLAQAAGTGGGGEKALLRHATAALLNAASGDVAYAFSVSAVIDLVKEAYSTGDYETVKNILAAENEKGCPLN